MQYLLAATAAMAIAFLLWRLLTAERVGVPADDKKTKRSPAPPVAPDDDPEFLRKLSEQQRKDQLGKDKPATDDEPPEDGK